MIRAMALGLGLLAATAGLAFAPGRVEAAGPWRGQVVDAETGQPLEGVVVVAVWDRLSPGVVHQARHFHDVDEVVTDAEGRFILPERDLSPPNPFVTIEGPQLTMFKGGYGGLRLRGIRLSPGASAPEIVAWKRRLDEAMAEFGRTGAVFELPPVKTREERVRALPMAPSVLAPRSRFPKFNEAVSQEHVFLGLKP